MKPDKKSDPLKPSTTILIALGSAVVHAEEYMSAKGHLADKSAFETCLRMPEVREWLKEMTELALLPVKR